MPPREQKKITNPRRILAVSLADSANHLSDVIKALTGTAPSPSLSPDQDSSSLAGTTHHITLSTPYYTASVPIWIDLIPSSSSTDNAASSSSSTPSPASEWASTFLSEEAKEVLAVLGGLILVFVIPPPSVTPTLSSLPAAAAVPQPSQPPPSSSDPEPTASTQPSTILALPDPISPLIPSPSLTRDLITQIGRLIHQGLGGWEWDGVTLAIGISVVGPASAGSQLDDDDGEDVLNGWEDLCAENGMEFVHIPVSALKDKKDKEGEKKRNKFGERVGLERVLEALGSNDWSGGGGGGGGLQGGEGGMLTWKGRDRKGDLDELKKAILGGGGGKHDDEEEEEGGELGEEDVEKLERMMRKLQAVRDATAGMPEEQRKRMAKKAVGEVMRELA
ncbi:uncharacterized protein CTHT_0069610 [Thermochaetoides thermophila DSM 1495]|uniref:Uncharacterized protein n=1 Tax=Chaetomium thermophilum (strain DSM 1495 / CBS 144.50 / IMI 039719) TaxID=759272 RepID=G0SHD2_CHATD|nr:hypothetical protein CTHT_0069610 [Thermochaetoides thermophila DSM 1495]EGS17621.1 hypothetical protein CTHT_0069610 [Thermochaetoides thermophila DSM 1495]